MRGDRLTEEIRNATKEVLKEKAQEEPAMGNDDLGGGYIEDDDQCKGITREEFDDICQRLGQVEKDVFSVKEMFEQFQTFSQQEIRNATKEILKEQAQEEEEFRRESR